MKIIASKANGKGTSNTTFNGRLNIADEKFFTNIIDKMDFFERQKAVVWLIQDEKRNTPIKKESFLGVIKKYFFTKKETLQEPSVQKTLKDFWTESLDEMKLMVTTKLPDEYVLASQKSNLGPNNVTFKITRDKEYVYGVSANIADPKFPAKNIKKAVEIISSPEYEKNFNEFKKIIPDLTENNYAMHNDEFTNPIALKWLDINEKLNKDAASKNLKVSLQLSKNGFGEYTQIRGIIKTLKDENIYEQSSSSNFSNFEGIVNELSNKLSEL